MNELEEKYPSVTEFCRETMDVELEGFRTVLETCKNCGVDNPKLSGDEIVSIVSPDGTGGSFPLAISLAVLGGVVFLFLILVGWLVFKKYKTQ